MTSNIEGDARLEAQLDFLLEVDKLKSVLRATPLLDGSRPENSGEHSWHVALWALILSDHAAPGVDLFRAIQMLLIHDIVEIDAGDTPIHGGLGAQALAEVAAAEARAADRLFGLLPADLAVHFRALWDEFEAAETPTAIYARSIDRAQPVLHNLGNDGGSWRTYDVTLAQLETRVGSKVARGTNGLWPAIRDRVRPWFEAMGRG